MRTVRHHDRAASRSSPSSRPPASTLPTPGAWELDPNIHARGSRLSHDAVAASALALRRLADSGNNPQTHLTLISHCVAEKLPFPRPVHHSLAANHLHLEELLDFASLVRRVLAYTEQRPDICWCVGWLIMDSLGTRKILRYLREWGLIYLGLTLFVWSLPLYVSWSSRPIFDRWSYTYFFLLIAALMVWLGFGVFSWRSLDRAGSVVAYARQSYKKPLSVSVLCWGAAYMVSALRSPNAVGLGTALSNDAGRVTDLNILGSTLPIAAALEWISIATFTLALGLAVAPRVPRRWQNVAVMTATLAFLIIIGEGFARARAIFHSETQGFPTYSGELWYRKYVQLNSWGFRDKERTTETGNEVRRILIVGDSFAFGVGVENPEGRFGEQLEERLRGALGRWEVINASRADTHTLQHIEFLRLMLDFQPELAILIYTFNDIDYLARVTRGSALTGSDLSVGRVLFLNSYLIQELYVRARKTWLARGNDVHSSPYDDEDLLKRHLTDLRRFVSLANEHGAEVRIVPFSFQSVQSQHTRYRRFVQLAMDFDLPVCSLEGAFEGHSPEVLHVNKLDGHPSAYANRLAVEAAWDCLTMQLPFG